MAIPGERDVLTLSIPTQTSVKGLRALEKILLYRTAARRDIFEIDLAVF
jgi:hypothetical protein